jgi:hypothetical protein
VSALIARYKADAVEHPTWWPFSRAEADLLIVEVERLIKEARTWEIQATMNDRPEYWEQLRQSNERMDAAIAAGVLEVSDAKSIFEREELRCEVERLRADIVYHVEAIELGARMWKKEHAKAEANAVAAGILRKFAADRGVFLYKSVVNVDVVTVDVEEIRLNGTEAAYLAALVAETETTNG